jgi:3-oxoacyl-[acyl-carrier protein] reductase
VVRSKGSLHETDNNYHWRITGDWFRDSQETGCLGRSVIGIARHKPSSFPGVFIESDLSDPKAVQETAREILKNHGAVDHLVNNVGLSRPALIESVTLEDFDAVINLNLKPALLLTQAFLPDMRKARYGRIINITSLVILGMTHRTAYSAAKAALTSFTRSWALELAQEGITVNAVAPGPTETKLFRDNSPPGSESERRFLAKVPMGRFAVPEEIAHAIDFFMQEKSSIITGQTLFVDGGASIGQTWI